MSHYNECDSVKELQEMMKCIMVNPINRMFKPTIRNPIKWISYWMFSSTDNTIYTGMILLTSLSILGIFVNISCLKNMGV